MAQNPVQFQERNERPVVAPFVISASRATDIPAFHAEWFMHRLREGHCVRINPFNRKQKTFISFAGCGLIVFWSKNPEPIIPHLDEIADRGINFYFQFTLNDYAKEGLEPGLPELGRRIEIFRRLSEKIGKDRVIWRVDPVLTTAALPPEETLSRIDGIGARISDRTARLVFSFIDVADYPRVAANLAKTKPPVRELSAEERLKFAEGLSALNESRPNRLVLATCAEREDFARLGIDKNKCVDPALICKLCRENENIRKIYGPGREQGHLCGKKMKDKSQRALCGCAPSRDIGAYNTCRHFCAYCYANHSPGAVRKAAAKLSRTGESLLP